MILYYTGYTGVTLPIIWKQLNCPFQARSWLCHRTWNTGVITTSFRRGTQSKCHFSYAPSPPPIPTPLSSLLVRDSTNDILKHFLHGWDMIHHVLIAANLSRKSNEDTVISEGEGSRSARCYIIETEIPNRYIWGNPVGSFERVWEIRTRENSDLQLTPKKGSKPLGPAACALTTSQGSTESSLCMVTASDFKVCLCYTSLPPLRCSLQITRKLLFGFENDTVDSIT